MDIFYVGDGGNVRHKYFGGGSWGPSWEGAEDLGGHVESVAAASWGEERLDIVGKTKDGNYVHKAWTGKDWYPSETEWEDFGGKFFSDPAVVSWGEGRLDIIGLDADTASLKHKYFHKDEWSEWEDLGGGPFSGTPVATSWGKGRLDFWAIDNDGVLNHLFWDGKRYQGWKQLGGEFTDTPKVVHWNASKIDIVGKNLEDEKFYAKSFDGSNWNPSGDDWYDLAGPFASEPGLVAKRNTNFQYIFGLNEHEDLGMQIWTGYDWQPGYNSTWSLGDVHNPYVGDKHQDAQGQLPLGFEEL